MWWFLLAADATVVQQKPVLERWPLIVERINAQSAFGKCVDDWGFKIVDQKESVEVLADAAIQLCHEPLDVFRQKAVEAMQSEAEAKSFVDDRVLDYRRGLIAVMVGYRAEK